jgi:predicted enzyme related to lactoylglutathione lyase
MAQPSYDAERLTGQMVTRYDLRERSPRTTPEEYGMDKDTTRPCSTSDAHVTGYCVLRLPVRNLDRSVAFYRDVIGYACTGQDGDIEAHLEPAGGAGPGLFLMHATVNEFRHAHWMQRGELYTTFEMLVDDLYALQQRLAEAGAKMHEPAFRGGYLTMGFFDPDGHFLFAVDRRGRYFSLKPDLEELLGRPLTGHEVDALQRVCVATAGRDELQVIQAILAGVRRH